MQDLAFELIEENKRTKSTFLDLGLCELEEIPVEILDCVWLEVLNLGNSYTDAETWEDINSENYYDDNLFTEKTLGILKGLPALKALYLGYLEIDFIGVLENFTNLQSLGLNHTAIEDIEPLANLTNLRELYLRSTPIYYLEPLQNLTNLRVLDLSNTSIKNIQSLQRLTGLQKLNINNTEIDDFRPLKYLSGLLDLNLGYANIRNLQLLQHITRLQKLNLSQTPIKDIQPLQYLINLQELDISDTGISDIQPLEHLTRLQKLSLKHIYIDNLQSLQHLTNLRTLELSSRTIIDIQPLQYLTGLQKLVVNGLFKKIDCQPLQYLTSLQELRLYYVLTTNVQFLQYLTNLNHLVVTGNHITDIQSLEDLTKLTFLDLGHTSVSNIQPLQHLNSLTSLGLNYTHISDIRPLHNLVNLQSLNLGHTRISYFDETILKKLANLTSLNLSGNNISNVLTAVIKDFNCLDDLKNYFKDKATGITPAFEAKIILVGNGRVGKTCLVRRWLYNTFNANEPSTHAIQLETWQPADLAQQLQLDDVRLNVWDFGGQDIYHATHRVFMKTEAIFLLVWDEETERTPEQEEILPNGKTIKYENRPLLYWLSYIKTLSNNSPVVVVQTKRNYSSENKHVLTTEQQQIYNVKATVCVESSEAVANGYETLKGQLREIVSDMIKRNCTEMPAKWYAVRNKIATLQQQNVKQIPLKEFTRICAKASLDKNSTQTLLDYLHNVGVLFYRTGLFNNQLVIDQKWAIDAVYTLFDRKGSFARLHNNGRFTNEDLQTIWQQYTQNEQQLFLSFMQQCEICFEVDRVYHNDKPFEERTFIVPQLLPDVKPLAVTAFTRQSGGIYYKYCHAFLHAAIIQRFIVRTGFMATENDMWKNGIILNTDEGMALVEANADNNEVVIRLEGIKQQSLLSKIRNEMREINHDETGIEELVSLDGVHFIKLDVLKTHPVQNEQIQAEDGTWIPVADYKIFLQLNTEEKFEKEKQMTAKNNVFISYSHKDKDMLEEIRTILKPLIRNNSISLWDDTKIAGGDYWKQEIDKALHSAHIAVLLVSPDFLASDFIAENELPPLLESAKKRGAKIIWIPIRHSMYTETELKHYQAAHDPAKPLAGLSKTDREEVLVKIGTYIKKMVEEKG